MQTERVWLMSLFNVKNDSNLLINLQKYFLTTEARYFKLKKSIESILYYLSNKKNKFLKQI